MPEPDHGSSGSLLSSDKGSVVLCVGFDEDSIPPAARLGEAIFIDLDRTPVVPTLQSPVAEISLLARSITNLRNLVSVQSILPSAFSIELFISQVTEWTPPPMPRVSDEPYWKELKTLSISDDNCGWKIKASFKKAVPSGQFLWSVLRRTPGVPAGNAANPLIGARAHDTIAWRPGDPSVTLINTGQPGEGPKHPGYQVWFEISPDTKGSVLHPDVQRQKGTRLRGVGRISDRDVPPLDEITVNPIGFNRFPTGMIGILTVARGYPEVIRTSGETVRLPKSGIVADIDIERLRPFVGVRLSPSLTEPFDPDPMRRIVVSLAAAGIPLTAESPAPCWQSVIEPPLLELIRATDEATLSNTIDREVHSIRLRRWALRNYSASAFWQRIARASGFTVGTPQISVVLPSRRPERLLSALRQIDRQRGVDLEVILALHGHKQKDRRVVEAIASAKMPIIIVEIQGDKEFDDVLNIATSRASGTYIARMDDDDLYGPDHLSDLVLAHLYSGAELTGCLAEFVYLEGLDTTVRRRHATEVYPMAHNDPLVGGGALLVPRYILESVGGFKAVPLEDLQLGWSVSLAGGRVYRHHGLNYVYCRRDPQDHLWKADYNKLLKDNLAVWPGRFINPLMELEL